MSKALKIIGVVIAVAAITVATAGIGTAPAISIGSATVVTTAAGASLTIGGAVAVGATSASIFGLSVATLTAIGTGFSLASSLLAPKPKAGSVGGSASDWKADPNAPIPYWIGRTKVGGNIVARAGHGGSTNPYQSVVTVYSGAGPIGGYEAILIDGNALTFGAGGAASGNLAGFLWHKTQLGAQPEPSALSPGAGGAMPGWDGTSKLSGMAASMITLMWDKDGKKWPQGEPRQAVVGSGVRVYDPRKDVTYPGGLGPQRQNDESTWSAGNDNPWLQALTWAIGRHSNGVRTLGVGMPNGIDVASFVEAANVADANGWKVGGVVYSTDDKWNVIKQMAQAGGGFPIRHGGVLTAFVNRPRVALLTLGEADVVGNIRLTAMQTRRARINGIVPRYRSEDHDWETVAGDVVRNATYQTEDGEPRTREADYSLVQCFAGQQPVQAAQLAAYDVADGREITPITVPLKPAAMALRAGDAVNLNFPSAALNNQLAIVMRREIDLATGTVTLAFRSETTSKHQWALTRVGAGPPTPALGTGDASIIAANVAAQTMAAVPRGAYTIAARSPSYPVTASQTTITIAAFSATLDDGSTFNAPAGTVTGQAAGAQVVLFAVRATGAYFAVASPGLAAIADPANVLIEYVNMQAADGTYSGGTAPPSSYGGGGGTQLRTPQQ